MVSYNIQYKRVGILNSHALWLNAYVPWFFAGLQCSRDATRALLFQRKATGAYNLAVNQDVHPVSANSHRTCTQIVCILAVGDSEVRTVVGRTAVKVFVDYSSRSASCSRHCDRGSRQVAGRHTVHC